MIAVIGDIHGCYHTLIRVYEEIKTRYPDIPVYSVGDLVDRGNFSYEVLNFIKQKKIKFTAGNHDLMFYYSVTQPTHPIGKPWIDNGSEFTMKSYSNHMAAMSEHFIIIKKAPLFFNLKDCFISHAGISSNYKKIFKKDFFSDNTKIKQLLEQELNSFHGVIWNRDDLVNLGKLQIVGHTIVKDLYHNKKSDALYIDTSAFAGNKLTAVIINNNKLVESIAVDTVPLDIA